MRTILLILLIMMQPWLISIFSRIWFQSQLWSSQEKSFHKQQEVSSVK